MLASGTPKTHAEKLPTGFFVNLQFAAMAAFRLGF
jgi:hypothetical protein